MRQIIKRGLVWFVGLAVLTGAAVAVGQVMSGVYNATPPTCTDGKPCTVQLDANGQMKSTATVTGTAAVTQSGTWTVQPGNTANTTAWKVDGSAVTQPVSGTVTANGGGTAGSANSGVASIQGIASMTPVQVSQATASNLNATVTDGAGALNVIVDSASVGQLPTGVGQQSSAGSLSIVPYSTPAAATYMPVRTTDGTTLGATLEVTNADNVTARSTATTQPSVCYPMQFDGSTWDRQYGDTTNGLDVDVTRVQGTVTVSGTVNGGGTAGSANAGVVSIQGIASMTPVQVSQATASNLNATVTDGAGALNVIVDSVTAVTAVSAILHTSGAETATGTGTAATGFTNTKDCWLYFHVSNADTDANDTLDMYVETSYDGGTTWFTFAHSAQYTGTTACSATACAEGFGTNTGGMNVDFDTALSASSIRSMYGGTQYRAAWTIVDPTGTNATFTFQTRINCWQ